MENKKKYILLSTLTGTLCFATVGAIFLQNTFEVAKADTSYEINFTSTKNKLSSASSKSGNANVRTDLGSEYLIEYENISESVGNVWQSFGENGYFLTKVNTTKIHDNAFYGLKSAKFTFSESGKSYRIYFSKDGTFSKSYSRSYATKEGENIIEFEGHPHYFKFEAVDSIQIINLKITYSCDESEDEQWDSLHGVNPVLKDDTINYGLYPKTIVSPIQESELLSLLLEKASDLNVEDEAPFYHDGEYYVKDTANPYQSTYYFSDGTAVVKGSTYVFKCEPIVWNICSTNNEGEYVLDCSYIPYVHKFGTSCKYSKSLLRTWLNENFYQCAFFLNSDSIKPTNFSEIGEDYDNIWIGSQSEYQDGWERYKETRNKRYDDFAICNRMYITTDYQYSKYAYFWTRTNPPSTSLVMIVEYNGELLGNLYSDPKCGVVPSITINL